MAGYPLPVLPNRPGDLPHLGDVGVRRPAEEPVEHGLLRRRRLAVAGVAHRLGRLAGAGRLEVAPVGREPLAHLPLALRQAPLALGPHVLGALGRLALLVALAPPGAPHPVRRPREELHDVEAVDGLRRLRHLLGDAGERDPDMSRVTSAIAALSPPWASGPAAHAAHGPPVVSVGRAVRTSCRRGRAWRVCRCGPSPGWSRLCRRA